MAAAGPALPQEADADEEVTTICDTDAALTLLTRDFPRDGPCASMPRVLLLSQLYSLLTDRTAADSRLDELCQQGEYRRLSLTTGLDDTGYASLAELETLLEEARVSRSAATAFLRASRACASAVSASQAEMTALLGEEGLRELLTAGFLARDCSVATPQLSFTLPGLGSLLRNLLNGRRELASGLRRKSQRQAYAVELEKRRLRGCALPASFVCRDMRGRGQLSAFRVPSGVVYRLV